MALFDDAFKYGVAKQMWNTVKGTVNTTIDEGFSAGAKVLRNSFGGSDVNQARHVIKAAMAQSDDVLTKGARETLAANADILTRASNTMGWSGRETTREQMMDYINNKATFESLQSNYTGATKYMAKQGHMTTRGKAMLGLGAYTVGTKIAREDNNAPLIPFL